MHGRRRACRSGAVRGRDARRSARGHRLRDAVRRASCAERRDAVDPFVRAWPHDLRAQAQCRRRARGDGQGRPGQCGGEDVRETGPRRRSRSADELSVHCATTRPSARASARRDRFRQCSRRRSRSARPSGRKEERERRRRERTDPRPQIARPADDADWLPVMDVLNRRDR